MRLSTRLGMDLGTARGEGMGVVNTLVDICEVFDGRVVIFLHQLEASVDAHPSVADCCYGSVRITPELATMRISTWTSSFGGLCTAFNLLMHG